MITLAPTSELKGITIVLIEQNAKQALQISDCGVVLKQGQPASKTQRRKSLPIRGSRDWFSAAA